MRIIDDAITKELAQDCIKEIEYKKKEHLWMASNVFWPEGIKTNVTGTCIQCSVSKPLKKRIVSQISEYLPDHKVLTFQFYIWLYNGAISNHNDYGHGFGVTIYLNEKWDVDYGGIFLWNDNNDYQNPEYYKSWKACTPKYRTMILNDNLHDHLVTPVSPQSPEFRYTIQIWGDPFIGATNKTS